MAETINDLYLKYVNEVGGALEEDRYFKYLYAMVQAGENTLTQKRQVLHKVVDERWLSTIEEALEPLNRIIEKPRRTIERNEEVVPVSLAKKITADSVRHLSLNTQFIADAQDGDIQPIKVLNVSVDETYNLYENRFIYHLIQRLATFIDKRTDVIFWSTGDEVQNTLRMESKVDDAYEQIDYAIEMKIKNLQSFAENDDENLDVFMRIDRVRRLVLALKNSSFCEIMSGCEKVRSPIQRTNLLTKDRDYKICYQLWGFLESYDEVGYTIEVEDQSIEIDEEYLLQMYTNLITNYTVFKSVTDPDRRDMEQIANTRRRVIRPKILTEVIEEEVQSRDIPDVEIKKVFVEEVTEAQLEAEQRLAEEIKLREETEEALRNAEKSASHSMMRVDFALSEKEAALEDVKREKELREGLEIRLEDVIREREEAYLQLQEKDNLLQERDLQLSAEAKDYIAQIEEQKDYYNNQIEDMLIKHENLIRDMEEDFKAQLENKELEYFEKMDEREEILNGEYDALKMKTEDALNIAEEGHLTKIKAVSMAYEKQIADREARYEEVLDAQTRMYEQSMEESQKGYAKEIADLKEAYEAQLIEQAKAHTEQLQQVKEEESKRATELASKAEETLQGLRSQSEQLLAEARQRAAADLERVMENARSEKLEAEAKARELVEKAKAEAKSEVDRISCDSKAKEEELNAAFEYIRKEKELLENANKELEAKLKAALVQKQELEVKNAQDKAKYENEIAVLKAVEDQVKATTVAEFKKALKEEKKLRNL